MNLAPDLTHDPRARSFVQSANAESANAAGCDFPIQNLPFGAFTNQQSAGARLCVAIGDQVFDLATAAELGLLRGEGSEAAVSDEAEGGILAAVCQEPCLNSLMGLGPERWRQLRRILFELLGEDSPRRAEAASCLLPRREVTMVLPVQIGNYTDFYASVHHAANVGALFRPENPLLPNYKWVPIGYHGRASSIVPSGAGVRRPCGQLKSPSENAPGFAPCRRLDYELEVGALVGVGNEMGEPIPIAQAAQHLFGLCLVNDWSARDIQAWEYQPLGPFLSKSFATSLSPWVVTAEALAPFRVPASARPAGDPQPLPYLQDAEDRQRGGFDVTAEVYLQSAAMRQSGCPPHRISRGNVGDLYWTFAQMLAHHTSNGCDLRPGDLLASGTVSGADPSARGCLLEMTRGGAEPILLPNGERRTFLEDGDEVRMRAWCQRERAARIGFGECVGVVLPAR